MSLRVKYCFRAVLSLIIIISLQSALLAGPREVVKWSELDDHLAEKSVVIESMPVIDCPIGIDSESAEHLVCQVIENTFYKWKEYEFFTAAGETRLAIEMIKPEARLLSADEAQRLLNGSKLWERQAVDIPSTMTIRQAPLTPPKVKQPVYNASAFSRLGAMPEERSCVIGGEVLSSNSSSEKYSVMPPTPLRESVHATDDRVRVNSDYYIDRYPWKTICYLDFMVNGESYRGSGILISPYCLLTCGHNLWDQKLNVGSTSIKVTPAQHQDYQGGSIYEEFGTVSGLILEGNSIYLSNEGEWEYDYGVVKLGQSFPGVGSTFMPVEYDVRPAVGSTVHLAGYPGVVQNETNSYDMWYDYDRVVGYEGKDDRILLHMVDASGGQSGSPVFMSDASGTLRLIAIHVFGADQNNGACRIVSAMESTISGWMAYEPAYTNFSYVPYFSTNGNRWTGLALANYNNSGNSFKVEYYAANGSPLGSKQDSLAAYGQGLVVVAASGSEGWAKISSTAPLKGLALVGDPDDSNMYDMDLKDSLHRKFLFSQIASNRDWNSTVMICNPNSSVANITLKYYNIGGTHTLTATRQISRNGSGNYALYELFGYDFVCVDGTMVFESDQPVTAFLLYDNPRQNWRAGLSAVPVN
ncbi:MAG: trypsin-like peptidase domain-containing protein [Pseudomonadota bacterium]|nr:trypsin-like peptidase domain-containing protein [Pseudomonadota bacterium]